MGSHYQNRRLGSHSAGQQRRFIKTGIRLWQDDNHYTALTLVTTENGLAIAWVSDSTYLPTEEGWHYLAVTMDLFSRRVVGWATAPTLETILVSKALERAIRLRGKAPGLIHHSDRGCQYASRDYRTALSSAGITASMSRKGNCYDNATMESFFATLKTDVFNRTTAASRRDAELMVFEFIETFYNPRRMHSSLGYKSPIEFETLHHQPLKNCLL